MPFETTHTAVPRLFFPRLTAMTFNLLYAAASERADEDEPGTWPQRRNLVRKVVETHRPDVVGFQEVEDKQLTDLREILPEYEVVGGPSNGDDRAPTWTKWAAPPLSVLSLLGLTQRSSLARAVGASSGILAVAALALTWQLKKHKGRALKKGGHCPIALLKERWRVVEEDAFWISYRPDDPGSLLPGTWLPRICHVVTVEEKSSGNSTGEKLQIFNTHLDWWFFARARGGRILAQQMNGRWQGIPQLLLGDFNAPRHSATWKELMDTSVQNENWPLRDAQGAALVTQGPHDTFHGGNGEPGYPGRIDHILTRPGTRVEKLITETLHDGEIYPSDHFPLVANLGDEK